MARRGPGPVSPLEGVAIRRRRPSGDEPGFSDRIAGRRADVDGSGGDGVDRCCVRGSAAPGRPGGNLRTPAMRRVLRTPAARISPTPAAGIGDTRSVASRFVRTPPGPLIKPNAACPAECGGGASVKPLSSIPIRSGHLDRNHITDVGRRFGWHRWTVHRQAGTGNSFRFGDSTRHDPRVATGISTIRS
jgi:hypothetical protein